VRIIASGCSFTYGHGLKDCFSPPLGHGPNPSKFAWPSVVANLTNSECINVSAPGGGNNRIIKQLLEVDLNEGDIVTVLWSYTTRGTEFKINETLNHGEWDENYLKSRLEYSNALDLYLKNTISIYNFTKYLESKNVKIIYQFIDELTNINKDNIHTPLFTKLWAELEKYDYSNSTFNEAQLLLKNGYIQGFALDGRHPNEVWHNELGQRVYNVIDNNKLM
jgi:hypothetical protein